MTDVQQQQPAQPSTPAEAATRLDQLKADPTWTGAFLAGGPAQKKEFSDLHELVAKGDNIDMAMAGEFMSGGIQTSDHMQNMGAAASLREAGIRDEIIRDVLAGTHVVSKAEYEATRQWKADRMSDAEWTKRLMAGDNEANRKWKLANIILTGKIKEDSAA
jgi:hypothetical protein